MDTLSDEPIADVADTGRLRRAAVIAVLLAGTALAVAVLVAPNAEVVDTPVVPSGAPTLPTPEPRTTSWPIGTGGPVPTASLVPTHDPVADSDCGPECFREPLGSTPRP